MNDARIGTPDGGGVTIMNATLRPARALCARRPQKAAALVEKAQGRTEDVIERWRAA